MKETSKRSRKNFTYKYPHPAVTTDSVVFGFDGKNLQVLLIQRGEDPYKGKWAFPGGFLKVEYKRDTDLEVDESAEDCARRELKEETGLEDVPMAQFHTFSRIERDPRERVITIAYYALVKSQEVRGGSDASNAQWFNVDNVPKPVVDSDGNIIEPGLAFDHDHILDMALRTLRESICFEPIGFNLMPEEFTIPQLQTLYESILGTKFDRSNFRNKILKYGLVDNIEGDNVKQSGRRAFKYRFNKAKYDDLKQRKGFRLEF